MESKKPTRRPSLRGTLLARSATARPVESEADDYEPQQDSFQEESDEGCTMVGMPEALANALKDQRDQQVVKEVVGELRNTGNLAFDLASLMQRIEDDAPNLSRQFEAMGLHTAAGMFRSLAEMGRTCAKYAKEHIQPESTDGIG